MAAKFWVVRNVDVRVTLADDPHDVDIVGELDEAEGFGDVARREGKAERNGDAEPEVRRAEQIVSISTKQKGLVKA